MSRKPEQKLWDLLRPSFAAHGLIAMRVENMLDDGFPDVVVQGADSHITFIETKARPDVPTRRGNLALGDKYGLRTSQRNWWLRYARRGGRRGLVVSRLGDLVYAHEAAYWGETINTMTYAEFCDEAVAFTATEISRMIAGRDWP